MADRDIDSFDTSPEPPSRPAKGRVSLRARALKFLSMREHSRNELVRKLSPHAESAEQVQFLLDEFEAAGYLSEQRFIESLVRRRGAGHGIQRVIQELRQHGIRADLSLPCLDELAQTELERAEQAWDAKFGFLPDDISGRARQHRYLAQRGFGGETISKLFRALKTRGG